MPSGSNSLGDILRRFEQLLSPARADQSPGAALFGGLSGIAGAISGGNDSGGIAERVSQGLLGGPLGLVASLFGSLFRKREDDAPAFAPLEKPSSLYLQYDVAAAPANRELVTLSTANQAPGSSATEAGSVPRFAPSVVVQVNAMDAQSFSSRSDDIASAVREALARNHALRDEIWED